LSIYRDVLASYGVTVPGKHDLDETRPLGFIATKEGFFIFTGGRWSSEAYSLALKGALFGIVQEADQSHEKALQPS
jgi:hypothetical protein